jgi:hypothetical protein
MNIYYTYLYCDPSRNNEPIYIGKGCKDRAYKHWSKTGKFGHKKHPFIQRLEYMYKTGIEPIIEFICKDVDEELAFFVEEEAIAKFGRKDLGKGTLLNLTDGGDNPPNRKGKNWSESRRNNHTPITFTEEIKQKIREKRKLQVFSEETRKKMSEKAKARKGGGMTGKKHSAETKAKISITKKAA